IALFDYRSLPDYEPVYLKDANGRIRKEDIGRLTGEIGSTDEWEVLSFNTDSMKVEWRQLKAVIEHRNDYDYLLKLTTETGKEITITPNHSVYTLDEHGNPVVQNAEDINQDSPLISPKRMPVNEKPKLNLLEILKESDIPTENVRIFFPRSVFPDNERIDTWRTILELLLEDKRLSKLYNLVPRHRETVQRNLRRMDDAGLVSYDGSSGTVEITPEGERYCRVLKALSSSQFKEGYCLFSSIGDIEPEWVPDELLEKAFLKVDDARWKSTLPVLWDPGQDLAWAMGMFVAEGWTDSAYQ
ncbi:MAG: hypothetical protein SVS85_03595, partial [Candidatus Nanohaloarchaea archaeon]|nr:hypothetical protein [Candidatus Nanohaloarchaea archaeon]